MRLIGIEFVRFWSRRVIRFGALIVAFLFLAVVALAYLNISSSSLSDAELQNVLEKQAECEALWRQVSDRAEEIMVEEGIEPGDSFESAGGGEDPYSQAEKEIFTPEQQEQCQNLEYFDGFYATEIVGDQTPDWSETYGREIERQEVTLSSKEKVTLPSSRRLAGVLPAIGLFLMMVAVVFGGSFIGAEYRSGTIENLLLWVPGRIRVFLAKMLAGALSMAALAAVLSGFLVGLLFALAALKGTLVGIDGLFWTDLLLTVGRVSALAAGFFVLSASVATITRHTVGAVGAILGWSILAQIIGGFVPRFRSWELFNNADAVLGDRDVSRSVTDPNTFEVFNVFAHSSTGAALIVLAWCLIPALLAMVIFSRRDLS